MAFLCPPGSEGWGPLSRTRPVDFTSCFQHGALVAGLNLAFTAAAAVRLRRLRGAPPLPRALVGGRALWTKVGVAGGALIMSAVELFAAAGRWPLASVFPAAMALQVIASAAAVQLHHREQLSSRVASSHLLLFWLGSLAAALMRLRTAAAEGAAASRPAAAAATAGYALAALAAMVLECRAKPEALYDLPNDDDDGDAPYDVDDVKCTYKSPEERAHLFSRLAFSWMEPLVEKGYRAPLQMHDISEPGKKYYPEVATIKFRRNWEAAQKTSRTALVRTAVRTYWRELALAAAYKLVTDCVEYLNPILLSRLIGFVSTYNTALAEPIENGYFYAAAMFAVTMVQKLALQQHYALGQDLHLLLRTNFITAVYRKALVLSNDTRKEHNIGGIVTHMSVDVERVAEFTGLWWYYLWSSPLQLVVILVMLYRTLGWSVVVGVLTMAASAPITARVTQRTSAINKLLMAYRDQRMKVTEEMLAGIRIIKLYAWESTFIRRINSVRQGLELDALRRYGLMRAALSFVTSLLPFLVSFATFGLYSVADNTSHGPLTPQLVFVSLALFNMLKAPLSTIPSLVPGLLEALVSARRISDFLTASEIDFTAIGREPYDRDAPAAGPDDVLVQVDGGSFKWLSEDKPTLRSVSIQCRRSELVAVIGRVGAGKSSLVSAILGDMVKCAGSAVVRGTVAYVPQQAWIMNATLRDNILFGSRFDQEFYDRVVDACALRPDIDMLPAGDLTEIGEKGINLSGGQKARVSLARAVYARADVYLLDDPLAAVDAHVGKHIFAHVLGPQGLLKTRARILVTNAVQYLGSADRVVMLEDGAVAEEGGYAECMARQGAVHEFIHRFVDESKGADSDKSDDAASGTDVSEDSAGRKVSRASLGRATLEAVDAAAARRSRQASHVALAGQTETTGRTTTVEVSQAGKVDHDVYRMFIEACGRRNAAMFVVALGVASLSGVGASIWLKHWASSNGEVDAARLLVPQTRHSVFYYLLIYGALGLVGAAMSSLQSLLLWTRCSVSASTAVHQRMLLGVLRSPMSFFDTTPVGRILNRFSADINKCDTSLPSNLLGLISTAVGVVTSVAVIVFSTPTIFAVFLPLALVYRRIQQRYLACSREVKRLLSTTNSPIVAHFQESVSGAATIRAYGHQPRFVLENEARIEQNVRVDAMDVWLSRWLTLRLETMGNVVMLGTNMLAIGTLHYTGYGDAGLVGLAVTYALQLSNLLSFTVKDYTNLENSMTHAERVFEYSRLPPEAPDVIEDRRPAAAWPEQGMVEFRGYSTRYREGLDLVLRDLSFRVLPGQKVGIVGRTGAGKSSLALALFRIVEAASGQILLDGEDIAQYGLFDVRSRLSIIPQDPVLFAGTVRENLDPFAQYSDQEIWRALELAHLADFVRSKDERLEFAVAQGGENFSVGQRQLICLARALLKRAKVLVLDEATAAIDNATDAIIQQTIRSEFRNCTVLTIAHRLNTIIDSDMVLVVDGGRLVEYDTPENLLQDSNTVFSKLIDEARATTAAARTP
ncbi:hypothetical protein H4R18_002986 [Coemansia javaensis]|uniref:Uncharacterized protein n=1 Tax=Coemansia javaensis TaxID=2761396 RepID=A0A9W8HBM4_9FUNG|nr:hypothetical protein H4R18_002986 [Coemansia javaensis]